MLHDFKAFALRGNVIDMAVGFVIGVAFGKVVSSFVNNIIMPPIGMIIGGVDFADLKIILKNQTIDSTGKVIPEVSIDYGIFINTVIDFIIIAAAIFLAVKAMEMARKKERAASPLTKEQQLLTEIRDVLKSK